MNNDIIKILNLKDTDIETIDSYVDENILYINLKLIRKVIKCPYCINSKIKIKDYRVQEINHPILNNMNCIIRYNRRRYKCDFCSKTFSEENDFISTNNRSTDYIILSVMNKLRQLNLTYSNVAKECNISVTEVQEIFDTHYIPLMQKLPKVLCIDEIHDPATGIGVYDCILLDFLNNKVVDYLPDRSKAYLSNYFTKRRKSELKNVKYISIDMWEPYRDIAHLYFKQAIVSVDSFHVIENIQRAFDKVRIRIMKKYSKETNEYYLLKTFSFLLRLANKNIEKNEAKYNKKFKKYLNLHDILKLQLEINNELRLAYTLKELYLFFNRTATIETAPHELQVMINDFKKSKIKEYEDVYKMLLNWKKEIINSFSIMENGERISNAKIESRNKEIGKLQYNANGMRNFKRLRSRIMYCINNDPFSINKLPNTSKSEGKKRGKYNKQK